MIRVVDCLFLVSCWSPGAIFKKFRFKTTRFIENIQLPLRLPYLDHWPWIISSQYFSELIIGTGSQPFINYAIPPWVISITILCPHARMKSTTSHQSLRSFAHGEIFHSYHLFNAQQVQWVRTSERLYKERRHRLCAVRLIVVLVLGQAQALMPSLRRPAHCRAIDIHRPQLSVVRFVLIRSGACGSL